MDSPSSASALLLDALDLRRGARKADPYRRADDGGCGRQCGDENHRFDCKWGPELRQGDKHSHYISHANSDVGVTLARDRNGCVGAGPATSTT